MMVLRIWSTIHVHRFVKYSGKRVHYLCKLYNGKKGDISLNITPVAYSIPMTVASNDIKCIT